MILQLHLSSPTCRRVRFGLLQLATDRGQSPRSPSVPQHAVGFVWFSGAPRTGTTDKPSLGLFGFPHASYSSPSTVAPGSFGAGAPRLSYTDNAQAPRRNQRTTCRLVKERREASPARGQQTYYPFQIKGLSQPRGIRRVNSARFQRQSASVDFSAPIIT